jgi:hypothetical protein
MTVLASSGRVQLVRLHERPARQYAVRVIGATDAALVFRSRKYALAREHYEIEAFYRRYEPALQGKGN